jgi:uncharacterized protein (DUF4213/DUF364 family)
VSAAAHAVAAQLVAAAARVAETGPVPRVRRLHLPPEHVAGTRAGEFCAVELEDGTLGLSFVVLDGELSGLRGGEVALGGADPLEVARGFAERRGGERAVGFATVNALTALLYRRAGFVPGPARDTLGDLAPGPGDHVGMVGLFPPLVPRVLATGATLTVVELRRELTAEHGRWRVTVDPDALRACSKVLCTSTVLLNDTLDGLLARCAGARAFALVGPGAACLPDPLFARGVTVLGGAWIEDGRALLEAIRTGSPWGGAARKCAVARDAYPGLDALVARARP